jgi:hypothetical protein
MASHLSGSAATSVSFFFYLKILKKNYKRKGLEAAT